MTWNHRVWQEEFGDETVFCIKETYYNSSGEVCSCTENATAAYGENLEELEEVLLRQLNAVQEAIMAKQDVLYAKGFEYAAWEEL
jgi:hypothetical protein